AGSFPADFGGGETVGNKIVAESVGHALLEIAGDYDEGSGCASCGRGGSLATSEVNGGGAFSTCLAAGGAGRQQRKAPENHYTEKEASYSAHLRRISLIIPAMGRQLLSTIGNLRSVESV